VEIYSPKSLGLSNCKAITSTDIPQTDIPQIFRWPEGAPVPRGPVYLCTAIDEVSPNRSGIRDLLASGRPLAAVRLVSTGELTYQGGLACQRAFPALAWRELGATKG
jgi:hypothetical protein